ncbi:MULTISPECIES: hypothetical protein [Enterobacteriaceae]|jgi:hypothetical protein|nr:MULTISPECIES: hypothetical protein [Enterobacteriaceae]EEY8545768.1 hypothetical protein [Escherichia coli]EFA0801135.1 hypothetical protein [Escherichia coli]EFA4528462.1 hypothetical protein [Escherichia coli]EFD1772866.1 hypothetical protein [Escherichia coli]EFF5433660.1 hypothetical protein [Escherichia coli]
MNKDKCLNIIILIIIITIIVISFYPMSSSSKGHDTQSISGDNFKLRSSFSREYSSCISNLKMIALDFAGHNIDFNSHSQFIASSGEEKILVKCTKDNKLLYMQNK